ncbi:hypothetical protein RYA71_14380 [Pseudomonas syringae pv. actinidiae]|uniref:hypothetical protein n=1 Tax=Pseudomonas syringae TaxID=317 RepID=UPI0011A49524|nr:hypothetical protein [Pseudomonas syringae]MDU8532646.1 hypothetical protein [Pseudomonas syringae pv. actinidiae]MDU8591294.1 hypothetical protein [Pseudomonas syringae pv. actinidiae]NVL29208.1 hypothetical protein [Pseudomonas syringae pv. actinidiae]NVL44751.1 hypothetical protein [Pseudomonas syringae pv. actinidiae]NVL49556.1 hypothetical protein [Pseudomonas syringae pv. actinidiae]
MKSIASLAFCQRMVKALPTSLTHVAIIAGYKGPMDVIKGAMNPDIRLLSQVECAPGFWRSS